METARLWPTYKLGLPGLNHKLVLAPKTPVTVTYKIAQELALPLWQTVMLALPELKAVKYKFVAETLAETTPELVLEEI